MMGPSVLYPLIFLLGVASITECQTPPPPTNVLVQFTGSREFTVAWDPPNHPVTGYLLQYSDGGTIDIEANATYVKEVSDRDVDPKRFTMALYSRSATGYSARGGFTILNPGDTRLPPPTVGTRHLLLPDTIRLDWTAPSGDLDSYRLVYSKNGVDKTVVDLPATATSYTILRVSGRFYMHLYTIRNGIISKRGKWKRLTSTIKAPLPPTDIYLQQTGEKTFTIAWTPPNDTVDGYVLMYKPDEASPEKKVLFNNSMTNAHIVCESPITDEFGMGFVSVRGSLHSEHGDVWLLLPGHELLPPQPVVTQSFLSPFTARLQLSATPDNSDFDHYRMTVNKTDESFSVSLKKGTAEYVLDGLTPGRETTLRITTVRNAIKSDPVTIQIPDPQFPKPNSPTYFRRHHLDRSSLVLNWDTPAPPPDRYYLEVRRDDPRAASDLTEWSVLLNGTTTSFVLSDLKRRGRYKFTIFSVVGDYDAFSEGVQADTVSWAPTRSTITIGAVTQHAMQVTWEPVKDATAYRLTLISDGGAARVAQLTVDDEHAAAEHVFLGLEEGMGYRVILDAVVDGKTMSAAWVEGETVSLDGDIRLVSYPPSTMEVLWTAPPKASAYIVSVISASGDDVRVIATDTPEVTIYDVRTEMPYEIGIRAIVDGVATEVGGVTNVIAKDAVPPSIISCPADITETISLAADGANVYWLLPEAIDDSGLVPLTRSSHEPGQNFQAGETIVSYVFTDHSDNEAECNFTVTVVEVDSVPPMITGCPENITSSIYAHLLRDGLPVNWTEPEVIDDSGQIITNVTHQPGSKFQSGLTVVTYRFADPSDNVATCNFSVTVNLLEDRVPPTIIKCPVDIHETIRLGVPGVLVDWLVPQATDDVGPVRLQSASHEPQSEFREGRTPVTYVFSDLAGNAATCNFTVTVKAIDDEPPVIIRCPSDINKTTPERPSSGVVVRWTKPKARDNSKLPVTWTTTHKSGTAFPAGRTNVTYTFIDASNNTASCKFAVTILEAPTTTPAPTTTIPTTLTPIPTTTTPVPTTTTPIPTTTTRVPTTTTPVQTTTTIPTTTTPIPTTTTPVPTTTTPVPTTTTPIPTTSAPIPITTTPIPTTTTPVPTTTTLIPTTSRVATTTTSPATTTRSPTTSPTLPTTETTATHRASTSASEVETSPLHASSSEGLTSPSVVDLTTIPNIETTITERMTIGNIPAALTARTRGICDCHVEALNLAVMSNCILPPACNVDKLLANMTDIAVDSQNIESFSGALKVISSGHNTISAAGIESFASILEHVAVIGSNSSGIATNIIASADNILNAPSEEFLRAQESGMASTRILKSLDFHLLFAHRGSGTFAGTESNLAAWTVSVPRNSTVAYLVRTGGAEVRISAEDAASAKEKYAFGYDDIIASIALPTNVYWYDTALGVESSSYSAIFTFYNNSKLFQAPAEDINSAVIAASVAGVLQEIHLYNDSVLITLQPWQDHPGREVECAFWNKSLGGGDGAWSTNGCYLAETLPSGHVVCSCNHLTHFALRLTPKVFLIDIIVFAGCVLCIGMMMAATMISMCIWARIPHRTIINICLSLLFLNGLFLGGIDQIKLGDGIGCTVIAALLQYFLLVSLSWTAVESLNLFWQVVLEREEFLNSCLVRVIVGCWGVPLLFVAYSRVIIYLVTDDWMENSRFCFLSPGPALYAGVVTPLALVLLFHLYIVALMLRKRLCSRFGSSDHNVTHAVRRCKATLPLSLLTTLGSLACYAMLLDVDATVYRVIFSVLAFALGALLLASVYFLGKEDLLDKECRLCCRVSIGRTSAYHVQKRMVGKKLCRNNGLPKNKQGSFRSTRFTRVGTFGAPIWRGEDV